MSTPGPVCRRGQGTHATGTGTQWGSVRHRVVGGSCSRGAGVAAGGAGVGPSPFSSLCDHLPLVLVHLVQSTLATQTLPGCFAADSSGTPDRSGKSPALWQITCCSRRRTCRHMIPPIRANCRSPPEPGGFRRSWASLGGTLWTESSADGRNSSCLPGEVPVAGPRNDPHQETH